MSMSSNVVNFPEGQKASVEDGFYRVANQLGRALCRVRLSDRESRVVQAVMMKTYGFNKSMDWMCNAQIAELTGIHVTNIGKVKAALKRRNILIVIDKQIGLNPMTDEWVYEDKRSEVKSQVRLVKTSTPTHTKKVNADSGGSQSRLEAKSVSTHKKVSPDNHNRQDTITKDKVTKDSARERRAPRASPTPSNFEISTELFNWATKNEIVVDLTQETEKFLDYHRAKGSTFKDWTAAWRNWMRNAKRFATKHKPTAANDSYTGLFTKEIQEWIDAPDASPISEERRAALMSGSVDYGPF